MSNETPSDYFGMSDEDFLKAPMPTATPVEGAAAAVVEKPAKAEETVVEQPVKTAEELAAEAAAENDEPLTEAEKAAAKEDDETDQDTVVIAGSEKTVDGKVVKEAVVIKKDAKEQTPAEKAAAAEAAKKPPAAAVVEKTDAEKAAEAAAAEKAKTDKPIDFEAFVKQILTPFKANGRTIELKTPEEAIRLMQMGAGYGRKIQDMQPHLKVLRMLEKADLLDEGKLSYLIDINSNNPDAIKKKIKESGIDPLDLNIADNVSYTPKNHSVSDEEMAFQNALSDIQSHEGGQETLRAINQTWDPESKKALWTEPQLLQVIQSQRDTGVYDQIATEIDRQKLLGIIPTSTPFLKAYKLAGDHLQANNGFKAPTGQAAPIQTQTGDTQQPQVIATRPAAVKTPVANGDKAAAASPTKTNTQRKAATAVNPLEMADDVFLKQFEGRL